jgi:hypothetical protein
VWIKRRKKLFICVCVSKQLQTHKNGTKMPDVINLHEGIRNFPANE